MNRKKPSIEMESLLKKYSGRVQYYIGSVMNVYDLQRIQVYLFIEISFKKIFYLKKG